MTSLDALNQRLLKAGERKEKARQRALDLGAKQRELADQVAAMEREQGDEQALEALRKRGGMDGAVAARTIAATMPDPERAKRFEALADELLNG